MILGVDSVRGNLRRTGSVQNFKEIGNDSLAKRSAVTPTPNCTCLLHSKVSEPCARSVPKRSELLVLEDLGNSFSPRSTCLLDSTLFMLCFFGLLPAEEICLTEARTHDHVCPPYVRRCTLALTFMTFPIVDTSTGQFKTFPAPDYRTMRILQDRGSIPWLMVSTARAKPLWEDVPGPPYNARSRDPAPSLSQIRTKKETQNNKGNSESVCSPGIGKRQPNHR
jgi:hypothetical protein